MKTARHALHDTDKKKNVKSAEADVHLRVFNKSLIDPE
jgi:hypothetical protein